MAGSRRSCYKPVADGAAPPAREAERVRIVMTDRDTYAEIAAALRFYLDGLYEGDVEKMRRVFHPCCHLYSAPDGALDDSDLESYLARVASRESPLALKQKRYDAILSIDCTAEGAAFVRLRTARAPRDRKSTRLNSSH